MWWSGVVRIHRAFGAFGGDGRESRDGGFGDLFNESGFIGREFLQDEFFGWDVAFACDADPQAPEIARLEPADERINAFVSCGVSPERKLGMPERNVRVVMHDKDVFGLDLVKARGRRYRFGRIIHHGLGKHEDGFCFADFGFAYERVPFFLRAKLSGATVRAEARDNLPADIVAGVVIRISRIAEADDKNHKREKICVCSCQACKNNYTIGMDESKSDLKTDDTPVAQERGRFFDEAWEIVRVLLISLAIVVPIRYFIVQPFVVRGASMEPNFTDSEYLVVDEISYQFREPMRGEVVIFRYPQDMRQFFIKRIVGLPGEKISIAKGHVSIVNKTYPEGFTLAEAYLDASILTRPDIEMTLGEDEYFVLGDNRGGSSDSRFWGPLARTFIVGKAVFSAWPLDRFGLLEDYSVAY